MSAWTRSLNRDIAISAFSAERLSTISQPVSMVTAPRPAAPRRNRRRDGSGNSFAASLISSRGSTPGTALRIFAMFSSDIAGLPAANHRAQAFRHQDREHDVHHEKADDGRHREEMDVTGGVIAAEHR